MGSSPGQTKHARARAGALLAQDARPRPGSMRMHLSGRPIESAAVLLLGGAPGEARVRERPAWGAIEEVEGTMFGLAGTALAAHPLSSSCARAAGNQKGSLDLEADWRSSGECTVAAAQAVQ